MKYFVTMCPCAAPGILMLCVCLGEDVLVVGYGALGSSCGPSLTSGILSRVITHQSRPVMLQTTCAVQSGASGGAVVRSATGELLGNITTHLI